MLRGAVGAAVAVAVPAGLAGCGLLGGEPEPAPEPDPLAGLLAATLDLVARYDAAMTTTAELGPLLTPVVATHRTHAEELSQLTGIALPGPTTADPGGQPSAPGSAVPSGTTTPGTGTSAPPVDRAAALTALRSAEEAAAAEAAAACHTAAADRAALLGSIAAARACHLEVLR